MGTGLTGGGLSATRDAGTGHVCPEAANSSPREGERSSTVEKSAKQYAQELKEAEAAKRAEKNGAEEQTSAQQEVAAVKAKAKSKRSKK